MNPNSPEQQLMPDVGELLLKPDDRTACETYIFEPSADEQTLGHLYIVAETDERNGIGSELLELVSQACQREYYREPSRGVTASFESALHQANLVLHDMTEQGIRDWMGNFHAVITVLTKGALHVSTAGNGMALMVRNSKVILVSQDLSYSPITNPLRTFAQVASGTVMSRDVLYLGSSQLSSIFRREDLARFAIDHSASTITTRLQQLYADQGSQAPLSVLVVSILPPHIVTSPRRGVLPANPNERRSRQDVSALLTHRQPIIIHRSFIQATLAILLRFIMAAWRWCRLSLWPTVKSSSKYSGKVLAQASVNTGRTVQSLTQNGWKSVRTKPYLPATGNIVSMPVKQNVLRSVLSLPRSITSGIGSLFRTMPRTSKVFAVLTIVLAVALVTSLTLLRHKRAEDAEIQRASEILHEAQTKQAAAETALIINNREQAQSLLASSRAGAEQLLERGFYVEEARQLQSTISAAEDRLQKITRISTIPDRVTTVGDFASVLDKATPKKVILAGDTLYSYNPTTNAIAAMERNGNVKAITDTTESMGFFTDGIPHEADKQVIFATDTPGIVILDTKRSTLSKQDIQFSSAKPSIASLAAYGNRLYVYDREGANIFSYGKTLSGYAGGTAWITTPDFPKNNIISFAIDGSVYTLHADGTIRHLFKGELRDTVFDKVEPQLSQASKIITSDVMNSVYVFDPASKRVIIFDKKGKLQQQVHIDIAQQLSDVAISPDGSTIYALDGSRVLAVSLARN